MKKPSFPADLYFLKVCLLNGYCIKVSNLPLHLPGEEIWYFQSLTTDKLVKKTSLNVQPLHVQVQQIPYY